MIFSEFSVIFDDEVYKGITQCRKAYLGISDTQNNFFLVVEPLRGDL